MKLSEIKPIDILPSAFDSWFGLTYETYFDEYEIEFILNEGEGKTYPRENLKVRLKVRFGLDVHENNEDEPKDIICAVSDEDADKFEDIEKMIKQFGWFISDIRIPRKGKDLSSLLDLKKISFDLAYVRIEPLRSGLEPLPKVIYHLTPLSTWESKIKTFGLSPKSKSVKAQHPARVYFLKSLDHIEELAKQISKARIQSNNHSSEKFDVHSHLSKWAVLEIDTSLIPKIKKDTTYFALHRDTKSKSPDGSPALYSLNYVPPKAITLLRVVDLSDK